MAAPQHKPARAGGILLAFSIVTGALVGALLGQPSIGMVAGLGVGIVLAGTLWLLDQRR